MASATMAAQAVTVAGLGSSMLREGDVQRLRGGIFHTESTSCVTVATLRTERCEV